MARGCPLQHVDSAWVLNANRAFGAVVCSRSAQHMGSLRCSHLATAVHDKSVTSSWLCVGTVGAGQPLGSPKA